MTGNSGSQKSGSSQRKEGPRRPNKKSVIKESTERKQEEDQLRYQASILETINDAIVVTDLSFRITFWNKASERVYGWKAEEVLGKQVKDILRSKMTPEQRSAMYSNLQNGNPVVTELVQLTRDDRELDIRGYTISLRDTQGKITGFVAVNQDVTEQKKKEAEREQLMAQLEEQRQRAESLASEAQQRADELDATFTALAEAVIVYDASGKAQRANPAAIKILGFDIIDVDITSLIGKLSSRYPDGRPIEPANTPSARALAGETVTAERFILTNAEGRVMTVIASSSPLWKNGRVSGAVTVWHDVTEREQLLNDVQRRAAELDTIITSIADGVIIQDVDGNIMRMNPAAQEMIDYSLEEQALPLADRATRVLKITTGEGQLLTNAEDTPVSRALRGEMVHHIQSEILHKRTGQKAWVLSSAAPLRTPDGAIFGAVATLTDITPLRKAEQALEEANAYLEQRIEERTVELADTNEQLKQALKREQQMQAQLIQSEKFAAISRLVASVAHELNNPIQTIQNCMFLLEQVIPLDDPSRDFLDMSISESKRIAKLVDQLRETYRPAKTYAAEVFDVLELLRNTQNILEPHLKQNHIQMKIKPLKEHILVNGVIDQIKQVFLNISLNAIESMQPAGGSLKISISTVKETDMVAIVFKDDGPGISKEDLPRIFEPFFTTKPKGTGLGLSICYEIVQSHGGKIIVNSQKGEGTTFSVWLPVCQ